MNNKQTRQSTKDTTKITALYSRLSNEDKLIGESGSIKNQKIMLEKHASAHGFTNFVHFFDDDYTGGNFDRPSWKKLMEEVEAGRVSALIVKDMSRFGRDHVQIGIYMELFRTSGIRFMSIGENIDSQIPETLDFAPFINIINEYYLRDTSRKIKASHKVRGMSGKRLTFAPIYGYMLDPNDKNKWIIDPEAAAIVKRIYHLTIQGVGPYTIARILSEEKIKRPSFYMYDRGIIDWKNRDHSDPYVWNGRSVIQMVEKPEYKGHTVNFRTNKESYKDKQSKKNAKEDWVIFENTHPGIVDAETWETAQRCRKTKRRTDTLGEANPLTGLIFCSDCGAKLYNRRDVGGRAIDQFGKEYNKGYQDYYHCSTHNNAGRKFRTQCTAHRIKTSALREIALEVIKAASKFVKEDEEKFIKQMHETSAIQQEQTLKSHKKRIAKEERRISELNTLIKRIYEDNVSGKLSDKRFELLAEEYEQEQSELELLIAQLQAEIDSYSEDSTRADQFINIVKRHTDFSELTPQMITEYIDKIIVYEAVIMERS